MITDPAEQDAVELGIAKRWCASRGEGYEVVKAGNQGGTARVFIVRTPEGVRALKLLKEEFSTGQVGLVSKRRIDQQLALGDHNCAQLVKTFDGGLHFLARHSLPPGQARRAGSGRDCCIARAVSRRGDASLARTSPLARHPGESRGPVFWRFAGWIPAYAGMTKKSKFEGERKEKDERETATGWCSPRRRDSSPDRAASGLRCASSRAGTRRAPCR